MLYCFKDYEQISGARSTFHIIPKTERNWRVKEVNKVTISFEYSKNEYISAFREYLFRSKILKKFDLAFVSVLAVFELFLLLSSGFSVYSLVIGMILIFYYMMFSLLYFFQPINVYNRTPKFHQKYKLSFSPENIYYKTADVSSVLNWDIYSEIWNCKEFFYLVQAKNIYTIIPKSAFKNSNDLQSFEKIILSINSTSYKNFTKHKL